MKILITVILSLISFTSFAQTVETNIKGVVIKRAYCGYSSVYGQRIIYTVSNRSNSIIKRKLFITAFDQDKDPMGNAQQGISLGPVSGKKYYTSIDCNDNSSFAFRFE